jgi:ABC-type glutathione transport system ATPase component
MTPTVSLRQRVERLKGSRDNTQARRDKTSIEVKELTDRALHISEARELLATVALETQEQLRYHISEIVSLAMDAVLDDPYELEVDFVPKRGKTECELWFSRDGERVKPMDASGGGAVDVAAFALRVAIWSLRAQRTRPTIVLDEPFRFLSTNLQPRAANMLKELSDKMDLQFVMVTHSLALAEGADKVIQVRMGKGKSKVEESNGCRNK